MRTYLVTRKLQITIPKGLAKQLGIRPGDAVVFEEVGGAVVVKKAGTQVRDYIDIRETVQALAADMARVRKHIRLAGRHLAADLSGHVDSQ